MTAALSTTVVGVFKDSAQADAAVEALHKAGFTEEQITVASAPAEGSDGAADGPDLAGGEMRILVTVRADRRREEVVDILKAHGAYGKGSPLV